MYSIPTCCTTLDFFGCCSSAGCRGSSDCVVLQLWLASLGRAVMARESSFSFFCSTDCCAEDERGKKGVVAIACLHAVYSTDPLLRKLR